MTIMPSWKSLFIPSPIKWRETLVTWKLCSTLSFLFHYAKWSFVFLVGWLLWKKMSTTPVFGQSMLMLEELFMLPTLRTQGRLTTILLKPLLPKLYSWLREGRFKLWLPHGMLPWNLCPVNARKRGDVNIRMEGFLLSCRANDALLALPTRQGKINGEVKILCTNYLIKFSFFFFHHRQLSKPCLIITYMLRYSFVHTSINWQWSK